MKHDFIALITARGGSKGLPRKNIQILNNKPLVGWTIESAKFSKKVTRVFVSTEDSEIAQISESFGAEIIQRPMEYATDEATSLVVIEHTIQWLQENNIEAKNVVLLQPTSPLRNYKHLDEAITLFENKKADFVLSLYEPPNTPVKAYIQNENGSIQGLYNNEAPYMRRQDLPKAYQPNGAMYIFSVEKFKETNKFPMQNIFPYVMSEFESIDIDRLDDLKQAEKRMLEINGQE